MDLRKVARLTLSLPALKPACLPTFQVSQPTGLFASWTANQPARLPAAKPTSLPTRQPASQATSQPVSQPACPPACQPSSLLAGPLALVTLPANQHHYFATRQLTTHRLEENLQQAVERNKETKEYVQQLVAIGFVSKIKNPQKQHD